MRTRKGKDGRRIDIYAGVGKDSSRLREIVNCDR